MGLGNDCFVYNDFGLVSVITLGYLWVWEIIILSIMTSDLLSLVSLGLLWMYL